MSGARVTDVLTSRAVHIPVAVSGPCDQIAPVKCPALALVCGFAALVCCSLCGAESTGSTPLRDLDARVLAATTRHLDLLLEKPERIDNLKGKSADGMMALAFYLTFESTGKPAYRTAALRLADRILVDMRATKFGVMYIKEKTKENGEEIGGGGPPAMGWYVSALAYVLHREGNRARDLSYVAGVLDRFPWSEEGWWAATIDVRTGQSKLPLTKPSPINKNMAMAMSAGIVAHAINAIDPALSSRLAAKARHCLERQIIPAQEKDGFWHYGLTGNDPNEKDVYGYFMLTTCLLLQWRELGGLGLELPFAAALQKAGDFACTTIAPITDPFHGTSPRTHASRGTPKHFDVADEPKRSFQLGVVLIGTRHYEEGTRIVDTALQHFPFGDRGQDAAQAACYSSLVSRLLRNAAVR